MIRYYFIMGAIFMAFLNSCSDGKNSKKTDGEKLLDYITQRNTPSIEKIVSQTPNVINFRDSSRQTILQCAICHDNIEAVKILINAGAEVNTKDNYLSTPLHDAAFHCNKEVIELLVNKGAKINEIDKYGETPLEANNSYEAMLKRRLFNPASIKNYKPQTEEEKKDISTKLNFKKSMARKQEKDYIVKQFNKIILMLKRTSGYIVNVCR